MAVVCDFADSVPAVFVQLHQLKGRLHWIVGGLTIWKVHNSRTFELFSPYNPF
jgi:hypothetical protein